MSEENVNLARRGYEALLAGDLQAVLEFVDPEVSVEVHTGRPDLPELLHGHAGFLENLAGLTDVFEDIEIAPEEFIDLGEHLVVPIYTAGHGRASGIKVESRVVHIWTIRDAKAIRFRVYGTRDEAFAALGLSEEGTPLR